MSREKNIFEKFPKKWPKGAFGKPVRGERGNHDLPSGAKEGEKMDLEHHYRHKQHTFDAFCKRTIRNESANAFRQVRVQQDLFVSLSDLPAGRLIISPVPAGPLRVPERSAGGGQRGACDL